MQDPLTLRRRTRRGQVALGASLALLSATFGSAAPALSSEGKEPFAASLAPRCAPPKKGTRMQPISLHPENTRYFLFRGKPTVLITSAAHYGQVLNLDFDYIRELDALQKAGLNYTRLFTGAYCEAPGDFNIENNVLAPAAGRLLCPWKRSETPGYANGGAKFDLNQWDDAYFKRLKDYLTEAGKRGIVVELSLFCPFYDDKMWNLSPMKAENNVNGVGKIGSREEVYTLKHADLTAVQEAMTRKIVQELRDFDNLFYEICNEPYFGGVTLEWQRRIAQVITEEEKTFPRRHLIAQNIQNVTAKVTDPDLNVSIFNFHYAAPPDAVRDNFALNRVIGCDETGFKGTGDQVYRTEGWDFMLAGGALYNNLDYSFTVAHPDGTAPIKDPTPGGGGVAFRAQMKVLLNFMESFDFVKMRPDSEVIRDTGAESEVSARALSEPGRAYALYIKGGRGSLTLTLRLPEGSYRAEWINPLDGKTMKSEEARSEGRDIRLTTPNYAEELALRLKRQ